MAWEPIERIKYRNKIRSPKEWCNIMGYDYGDVQRYAHSDREAIKEVVEKLLGYVYEGKRVNIPFRDKRNPTSLIGMCFGRLRVQGVAEDGIHWVCKCSCGNTCLSTTRRLMRKDMRSCGCGMLENREYFGRCSEKGIPMQCRRLTYKKNTMTISEWAKQPEIQALGIKRRLIYLRLQRGWSIQETLSTPCGESRYRP